MVSFEQNNNSLLLARESNVSEIISLQTQQNPISNTIKNVSQTNLAVQGNSVESIRDLSPVKAISSVIQNKNNQYTDVVILNPSLDGGGDFELANKIAKIAADEGCRVVIIPFEADDIEDEFNENNIKTVSSKNEYFNIKMLKDPIFIVAPVTIVNENDLSELVDDICEEYGFKKNKIYLIEELGYSVRYSHKVNLREEALYEIGFEQREILYLGFGKEEIGFISLDQRSQLEIKKNFEAALKKLFDSYHFSLSDDYRCNLAYISESYSWNTVTFFLTETLDNAKNDKNLIYLLVVPQYDKYKHILKEKILSGLTTISHDNCKVHIVFIDSDSGKIISSESNQVFTKESKKINIIFTKKLPHNIFNYFMYLSDDAMMTGDQSLSDYLTLKGKMPYYEVNFWKRGLAEGIKSLAFDIGGRVLRDNIERQLYDSSNKPSTSKRETTTPLLTEQKNKFNQTISGFTANEKIRQLFIKPTKN